jgi:tRNA1(Val) A37 N6-methylase TrmN6
VIYRQPASGLRSGIEPVLLAASVPARPHDHVLEAGTGAGPALLCLTARVPGVKATGVEADAPMASLAAANAHANNFTAIDIIAERIEAATFPSPFDHAIANPPYHRPDSSPSPIPARDTAKRGSEALMATWIERLSGALRDRGSLTLVVPAGMVPACLAAMSQYRCPCIILFPLWPKTGRPAKLVLLRGVKNGLTPLRLAAGLVLHNQDGSFTPDTQAILTDGSALLLDR